jgi:inosose dehydratase
MIQLAAGPVSWGVDFADAAGNPPYADVLAGIAAAGLDWMELGPVGYVAPDAPADHGLRVVGTFVFDAFHAAGASVLSAVDAALDAIAAAEGRVLVLIDRPSPARAATAGRSGAAPRLRDWSAMVESLAEAGDRAAARGIRAVVHPHSGGYIEFEDEIELVLEHTGLGLCLDTGHALYAGSDPAALIRRYRERLEHVHLKDLSSGSRPPDFWDAVRAGVFCPVGDGRLDLDELRDALADYDGFATVEQDRRADSPGTPAEDLRRSVRRLRATGLG